MLQLRSIITPSMTRLPLPASSLSFLFVDVVVVVVVKLGVAKFVGVTAVFLFVHVGHFSTMIIIDFVILVAVNYCLFFIAIAGFAAFCVGRGMSR